MIVINKCKILLLLLALTVFCLDIQADINNVQMHSTSAVSRNNSSAATSYRSSFGKNYTGKFRNNIPLYRATYINTLSSATQHSYGGTYITPYSNRYGNHGQEIINYSNGIYTSTNLTSTNYRSKELSFADFSSAYAAYQESVKNNKRRIGGIDDWFDELLQDYISGHGNGYVGKDNDYEYYNEDWLRGLYEYWLQSGYGSGLTPDLFNEMLNNRGWKSTNQELPLNGETTVLLLATLIYFLVKLTQKLHSLINKQQ